MLTGESVERQVDEDQCSNRIIGSAIEVHRILGPGLLESAYEAALAYQLRSDGMQILRQPQLAIVYKEIELPDAYRIDILVEDLVVVEIKAVDKLLPLHSAQLATYLKFSRKNLGLLLNFNCTALKDGIKRMVSGSVFAARCT